MKRILPILFLTLATACGTSRSLQNSESSRVEVRTETVIQHDTAYVELPVIVEKVATLDTTSTLENTYARSEAIITKGILHHSLETRPVSIPVKVETKTVYRDSLVYVDRVQTQTVEVKKPLKGWQKSLMLAGVLYIIICILLILKPFLTHFIQPKL